MSDVEEKDLLAGHPPAMRVGGMRVAQPKKHHDKEASQPAATTTEKPSEEGATKEEAPQEAVAEAAKPGMGTLVNGVYIKDKIAFPTEAVKKMHEKPIPKHEFSNAPNVAAQHSSNCINQPGRGDRY